MSTKKSVTANKAKTAPKKTARKTSESDVPRETESITEISVLEDEVLEIQENQALQIIDSAGELIQQEIFPVTYQDPQRIMESKRYVKGGAEYKSPLDLLMPCINVLSATGGQVVLTGSHEEVNANQDGSKNISYGRLNLICRFELDTESFYEIGVLVAYDLQIPKIKIYRGPKVRACLNLCIFEADEVVKFDITSGINMEQVQTFITGLAAKMQEAKEIIARLKSIEIQEKDMERIIGAMTMRTISEDLNNGTTSIIRAVEILTDDKSKYYYKQPGFNAWLLFNSFTEFFSKKINFFDVPEKTRDTFKLLKDICLN